MKSLIERLRTSSDPYGECRDCYEMERREAADEIERLRAALDRSVKSELRMEREAAEEIERLRVALHKSEAGLLLAQFELQALTGRGDDFSNDPFPAVTGRDSNPT